MKSHKSADVDIIALLIGNSAEKLRVEKLPSLCRFIAQVLSSIADNKWKVDSEKSVLSSW